MPAPTLLDLRKLMKRVRQLAYVGKHPMSHSRCAASVRNSGVSASRITPLKYVGDHLALSLKVSERRHALTTHYSLLPRVLSSACASLLRHGVPLWRKEIGEGLPDLAIDLEPSKLAPMEGELQLRFSFRSDLCVLTFLVAPGIVFGSSANMAIFIGGVQGRIGAREEMREAARSNHEIAPAAMLIMTMQAIAKQIGVDGIIAIGEHEHISLSYASSIIAFDYRRFWREAGGVRVGRHYRLPMQSRHKPLSKISRSHRSCARRRREAKALIRQAIERRVGELFCANGI